MADVLSAAQRQLNMSRIKGKNTRPEMLLRRSLFSRGLRFRLHKQGLPGKPDMVFAKYKVCLFVHGCFWHGHRCSLFKVPRTRTEFWMQKINGNQTRDAKNLEILMHAGWRVMVVWECAIRGPRRRGLEEATDECVKFILGALSMPAWEISEV